jgi:hypothetical protein
MSAEGESEGDGACPFPSVLVRHGTGGRNEAAL